MIVWPESVFTLMLCGAPQLVMAADWDSVVSPGSVGELLHEAAPPIATANNAVNHEERVAPPLQHLCHRRLPVAPEHLRREASWRRERRNVNGESDTP